MSNKLMSEGNKANTPYKQYLVDTVEDLDNIQKSFGTIALCLEDKKIYVCDSEGNWVKFGE